MALREDFPAVTTPGSEPSRRRAEQGTSRADRRAINDGRGAPLLGVIFEQLVLAAPSVRCAAAEWGLGTVTTVSQGSYDVTVSAGAFRPPLTEQLTVMPHRWTTDGVVIDADFTGAHLYHLAAAGCVLNDLYREAAHLGIELDGARVTASGGFDPSTRSSTGVTYRVEVASHASAADVEHLVQVVDQVAEIPKALRLGTTVDRSPGLATPESAR